MQTAMLGVRSRVGRRARRVLLVAAAVALAGAAPAQETTPPAEGTGWELGLSAALYVLPDDEDFVQPTLRADHGLFHFETRYNYEDRDSTSFFVGANLGIGEKAKLTLTPMIGGLVGRTDGIVPGLEADITVGPFEAYGEAEYMVNVGDSSSSYFYMWSELSWWGTDWVRAGLATQRTRVYRTDREIQRGPLVGARWKSVSGSVYWFNPGADDWVVVASVGVSF